MTETTYYAVGDIHGQLNLLRKIHAAIRRDAREHGVENAEIIYLGDYINRGHDPCGVIEELLERPLPWPAVHLRGNHEAMLLGHRMIPGYAETMMEAGGIETLESYGLRAGDFRDSRDAAEGLWRAMPESHRAFVAGTRLSHRRGSLLFVHAGILPDVPLADQRDSALLWVRQPFLMYQGVLPEGVRVIHGHTIRREVEIRANRIGVDTGAFKHGRLSAVALTGDAVRVITVAWDSKKGA
jgi:serine/threonine protein phosphatase 1